MTQSVSQLALIEAFSQYTPRVTMPGHNSCGEDRDVRRNQAALKTLSDFLKDAERIIRTIVRPEGITVTHSFTEARAENLFTSLRVSRNADGNLILGLRVKDNCEG